MRACAFCPAHITGFFKAIMIKAGGSALEAGSVGAGFSISQGVRTSVDVKPSIHKKTGIKISGYNPDDTIVSECVIAKYEKIIQENMEINVHHEINVPVGYGLGCSAAVALSLSLALNAALGTNFTRKKAAQIAHTAEIECNTGLGDVLGALDGGFEIRTSAGAPGIGTVSRTDSNQSVILVCLAPMSTKKFMTENIEKINGLGGKMVDELHVSHSDEKFQEMSVCFARYINVITPRMQKVMEMLESYGIKYGVALFGETIFTLVDKQQANHVLEILRPYERYIQSSSIDNIGARLE